MSFFMEYIKHPMVIGAVAPSSRFLAKKMVKKVDFQKARCIVEYGPGTGIFTKEVVKRKHRDCIFLIIEQNEEFSKRLQDTYKNEEHVFVVHGDAAQVEEYLKQLGQTQVDYVLSGLPFTSLPQEVSKRIFEATQRILGDSGKFITFQYTLVKKRLFQKWFQIETTLFEMCNLPPAFVLVMENE